MNQYPDFTPIPDVIFEKDLTQENVIYRTVGDRVGDTTRPSPMTQQQTQASQTNPLLIIGLVVAVALIFGSGK